MSAKTSLKNIFKPVDLTTGKPWKVLLLYGAPIMVSYLLQQLYVLTDAIICGQVLDASKIAGVNDTSPLTFFFLQFAFGCTAGFSVITANYVGLGDKKGVRKSFATQIYLSLIISVILTAVSIACLPYLLNLINVTPDNKDVYDAAYDYCFVIFIGIFAQIGYNFICGILRAYGDSVTPLAFLLVSTLLNVGFDVLFLVPLSAGPKGAAFATVLAQFISFIACFLYTMIKYEDLRLKKEDFAIDFKQISLHLKQGIPLGLQFSVLAIGIIVMQGAVVKFDITKTGVMVEGTPAQIGFGAANKTVNFLMAFYNGLSSAILGFNAQNYGKGDYEAIKKGTLQALLITAIIYLFCLTTALLLSINGTYQYVFMSADKISPQTIKFGNIYLYCDFSLYFILGFLIIVRSAVQGVGKSGCVLIAGIAELTARVLICAFLPVIVNGGAIEADASSLAFLAVCAGDPGAWIFASLTLLYPFFKNIIGKNYTKSKTLK